MDTQVSESNKNEIPLYDGPILNIRQRSLFFEYLGMKLKLSRIIIEGFLLAVIIIFILTLGAILSNNTVEKTFFFFFKTNSKVFSFGEYRWFILLAISLLIIGYFIIATKNFPRKTFKSSENIIMEEITMYLFLPALSFIKHNASNFSQNTEQLLTSLQKQMTDIGYTDEYVQIFFERYNQKTKEELDNIIATLSTSSDLLLKKMPGMGKVYASDFKPVIYIEKAIFLCSEFNQKYCYELIKQQENERTIMYLRSLFSADDVVFMKKTRDKIADIRKQFVNKHIFDMQKAEEYTLELFIEPLVWFLHSPNLNKYSRQIIERKLKNLGCAEGSIRDIFDIYDKKKSSDILQSIKEKNNFARTHGIKTDALNSLVLSHCRKECDIYLLQNKNIKTKADTDNRITHEEILLQKLEATLYGKKGNL